jgi:hypothetical protein
VKRIDYPEIERASYVLEERLLRRNLATIKEVSDESGAEIILAFKSYALWRTFPIFREYGFSSTASSLWEARLGYEEMKSQVHAFTPAYLPNEWAQWQQYASHISFNSLSQYERYKGNLSPNVSYGIRINPEYSPVETDLYNPALPGSRFGVTAEALDKGLPEGIEGLHFHVLCEGNSFQLERTLGIISKKFDTALRQAQWLNMGGGHLMTHKEYNIEHLVEVLKGFKQRYPHLKLILEPGSAFAWQTGFLISHVVDIVSHAGIQTAILDVSFTCHMPDCLEMPYKPIVRGAHQEPINGIPTYRLGGMSCLSGDYIGSWSFDEPLEIGDEIIFEDMLHYTTVKTNMFNGVAHPDIVLLHEEGGYEVLRHFTYEDYKRRMD